MRARFEIVNADELEFEVTIKAPMKEWRKLRDQMSNTEWPAWDLHRTISDVVSAAERHFISSPEAR